MKRVAQKVLNFFLPHRCPVCTVEVHAPHTVCSTCWGDFHFIADPFCKCCGLPFEFQTEASLCAACAATEPPFSQARAVVGYTPAAKSLILPFKHLSALHIAPLMARWMVERQGDIFKNIDLIIPVPLHWQRLIKRKYNQAGLMAQNLSKLTAIPVDLTTLQRIQKTASQGGKTRKQRFDSLKGVFAVMAFHKIKDKRILLIDDVFTTGATVEACAKTLLKAGAKEVRVLTFARVNKPGHLK